MLWLAGAAQPGVDLPGSKFAKMNIVNGITSFLALLNGKRAIRRNDGLLTIVLGVAYIKGFFLSVNSFLEGFGTL